MSGVTVSSHPISEKCSTLECKTTVRCEYLIYQIYTVLVAIGLVCLLFIWSSCGAGPFHPVSEGEEKEIKMVLEDRSFRQFDPDDIDASPRKAVILDFFNGIELWAQYAEGDHAINEWKIIAADYRIEKAEHGSEIKIYFDEPSSMRTLPDPCEDCIETSGISISIRDAFDSEKISFKLNDPDERLPSPFPVFTSWTRFREDEYFD